MKPRLANLLLLALMLAASGMAMALRPHQKLAEQKPQVDLETMIPYRFAGWRDVPRNTGQIINPQESELLAKLYSQTLSRTYVNQQGATIMLSIAYGATQSDSLALHYPEVCYPAQGFQVLSARTGQLETPFGDIRVKRLLTQLGERSEPVTYWTTLGKGVVQGGLETKLAQLRHGFRGEIPDGMLVRVSSIDRQADHAYAVQAEFAAQMVAAVAPEFQLRFAGVTSAGNVISRPHR